MDTILKKEVLIAGASIAGLTLAYWLAKAGYRVTVVELAAQPRRGGAAINVQGEALASAKRMGIYESLLAQRLPPVHFSFVEADADVDPNAALASPLSAADDEVEEIEIERNKLLAILLGALPSGVGFLFNNRLTGLRETADALHVTFSQGAPRTFDLVFGCDGLHSGVRKLWFGPEAQYACFLNHYASLTIVDHLLLPPNTAQLYNTPGQGVLLNAYNGKTDIIFWFFSESKLPYDYRDTAQQQGIVHQQFVGQGWRTTELLAEVQQAGISYFEEFCQIKLPAWSKGRVALVGDAAYCASPAAGIGASLAMQGATELAEALATHAGEVGRAFAAYEHALRPHVEQVQATAVKMLHTFFVPKTAEAIQARNAQ
jgi:2-polyprenyl-6-methoxyphenol hydroxylase-like FAD-dependent oxidoreductase